MHGHRDALRVMVKSLVKDLWLEWRKSTRGRKDSRAGHGGTSYRNSTMNRIHAALGNVFPNQDLPHDRAGRSSCCLLPKTCMTGRRT
jgi:hypothetical protein